MWDIYLGCTPDGAFGTKSGSLPWSIKELNKYDINEYELNRIKQIRIKDMNKFKEFTNGKNIIMGYNTYKSIGGLLKNRTNYIISNKQIKINGATVMNLEEAIKSISSGVFIGGIDIFWQLLKNHYGSLDKIIINLLHIYIDWNEDVIKIDINKIVAGQYNKNLIINNIRYNSN